MYAQLAYNPAAGLSDAQPQLARAVSELRSAGWTVDLAESHSAEELVALAAHAGVAGYQAFLVAGGDGSINLAANGLMQAARAGQSVPALGILPSGTANVLARDLGLPVPGATPEGALPAVARLLARARVAAIDVGVARSASGERSFLCWAGVGLDAAITADVMANPQAKRRLGALYFAGNLLARLARVGNAPYYSVEVDGQTWHGRAILTVVSNIQHYAVVLPMAPSALLNDGLLDVSFFHGITLWNGAATLARLLTSQHASDPRVRCARARRVRIDAEQPQHVHLDAEPFGVTPLEITVESQALPILAPPTLEARRLVPPR